MYNLSCSHHSHSHSLRDLALALSFPTLRYIIPIAIPTLGFRILILTHSRCFHVQYQFQTVLIEDVPCQYPAICGCIPHFPNFPGVYKHRHTLTCSGCMDVSSLSPTPKSVSYRSRGFRLSKQMGMNGSFTSRHEGTPNMNWPWVGTEWRNVLQ